MNRHEDSAADAADEGRDADGIPACEERRGVGVAGCPAKNSAGEAADISAKLDRILDRLDKIEQQISRLNAARKPRVE